VHPPFDVAGSSVAGPGRPTNAVYRQGEKDDRVAHVLADIDDSRWIRFLGYPNEAAIGHNDFAGRHGNFSHRQQVTIDIEAFETPGVRIDAQEASSQQIVEVPVLLLKMLRSKKHALRPDDATK
jgi:hypothetical protein